MNDLIIFSNGDDWEGLFVNGELVTQGHDISISEISKYVPIASIDIEYASDKVNNWLYDYGRFPDKIKIEDARVLEQ